MTASTLSTIVHDRFVIERVFKAPPTMVFAAFATVEAKRRWFGCHEGIRIVKSRIDFRAGSTEFWHGWHGEQVEFTNQTVYHQIVADQRIVLSYTMTLNGKPLSSSLLTQEFHPHESGTRFVLTEHVAVLDGSGEACVTSRIHGTGAGLDNLQRLVEKQA
jgi:uncharacterized protein YndB with AHSA1/START domain